jgi:hypothetical protein
MMFYSYEPTFKKLGCLVLVSLLSIRQMARSLYSGGQCPPYDISRVLAIPKCTLFSAIDPKAVFPIGDQRCIPNPMKSPLGMNWIPFPGNLLPSTICSLAYPMVAHRSDPSNTNGFQSSASL